MSVPTIKSSTMWLQIRFIFVFFLIFLFFSFIFYISFTTIQWKLIFINIIDIINFNKKLIPVCSLVQAVQHFSKCRSRPTGASSDNFWWVANIGFSAMMGIKNKHRNNLNLTNSLRLKITKIDVDGNAVINHNRK